MKIQTKNFMVLKKRPNQLSGDGLSGLSTMTYAGILIFAVIVYGFIKAAITGEDLKEDGKS